MDQQRRIVELRGKMRRAVADTEETRANYDALTSNLNNFDEQYKVLTSPKAKDLLAAGAWAHRRAQTYALALQAELRLYELGMDEIQLLPGQRVAR